MKKKPDEFYIDRAIRLRLRDGVYVDMSEKGHAIWLGIVRVVEGKVAEFHRVAGDTNSRAGEKQAIRLAQEMFPDLPVYCDDAGAARACGAVFIPRTANSLAHRVARGSNLSGKTQKEPKIHGPRKLKRKFRRRGRGVVPVEVKRVVFA